jgi:hypothetical protein
MHLVIHARLACRSCWAFSPPGGLASPEVGAASSDWCTSVVCGKEWIPRLSIDTFNRMRVGGRAAALQSVRCALRAVRAAGVDGGVRERCGRLDAPACLRVRARTRAGGLWWALVGYGRLWRALVGFGGLCVGRDRDCHAGAALPLFRACCAVHAAAGSQHAGLVLPASRCNPCCTARRWSLQPLIEPAVTN